MKTSFPTACARALKKVILLSFTGLAGGAALAQDKTADIEKLFSWATPNTPGAAVVISQNGKVLFNKAYGSADLERDVAVSPNTVFDIGSTRKQFVAAAILMLAEDKKLSLSDDVRKYITELPDYGVKITLDNLLQHTSGIRDWTGILPLSMGDPDAMTVIMRQRGINFAPGTEMSYSNSGYVLLTEIVTRTSGMSFAEFTRKRIFEPLGMKSTRYVEDLQEIIKNRAQAYEKGPASWKLNMLLGNDRGGAGALFSTASDLTIWNDALTNKTLGAFVSEKLEEKTTLSSGRVINYARGLVVDPFRGGPKVWHSGGAAGYHSWMGRLPVQGLSVVVLCNSDAVAASALANRIIDLFVPPGAADPEAGAPPTLTGDALAEIKSYAGLFFNESTGDPLTLSVDRDRFRVAGGPGLAPVTKGRFRRWGNNVQFMSQDAFELNFLSADKLELKSMEGKITGYRRAKAYAPTAIELAAFTGRYQSDEIGGFFDMNPGNGVLKGRSNESGETVEFKPVDKDTFQIAGVILRFLRDKAGKVTAIDFSNPVVEHIKFTKVNSTSVKK